jgi:hypothetical protein
MKKIYRQQGTRVLSRSKSCFKELTKADKKLLIKATEKEL